MKSFNKWLDRLSNYFAARKGLLPLIGIALVVLNFIAQYLPLGWLAGSDLFLHLGVILGFLGVLLAWAL